MTSPSWAQPRSQRVQLDRHDIIETEANSSATSSLALFSGCDISKSSIAGSALRRSCGRQTEKSGLYIRPRKPFAINQYLYIQNRNPFVISISVGIPQGGVFRLSATPLCQYPICIYIPGSPLSSISICIYRTATHLLSTNRRYIQRGWYTAPPSLETWQALPARTEQAKPAAARSKPLRTNSRYHPNHRGGNIYATHIETEP
jgi:hypothetical protein